MEQNIVRRVFKRENRLLQGIFTFFLNISSFPRMVIEVFTRREMGRRYFGIATAVTVAVLLSVTPIFFYELERGARYMYSNHEQRSFLSKYATWYIFVVLFIAFADRRAQESHPGGNVFDYDRFSLSTGYSLPIFYTLPFFKKPPRTYTVEVYIEPATFFLIGLVLLLAAQPVGGLFIWCSIAYSFSYAAAYKFMDDYFQDLIDMRIMNEETMNSFVYGMEPDKTRGVFFDLKPSSEDLRRKMASQFFRQEQAEDIDYTVV